MHAFIKIFFAQKWDLPFIILLKVNETWSKTKWTAHSWQASLALHRAVFLPKVDQPLDSINPNRFFEDFCCESCSEAGESPVSVSVKGCLAPQGRALQSSPAPQGLVPQEPQHRKSCCSPTWAQSYLTLHFSLLAGFPCADSWLCSSCLACKITPSSFPWNLPRCLLGTFPGFCKEKYMVFNGSAIKGVSQSFTSLCSLIFMVQHSRICWKAGPGISVERDKEASPSQGKCKSGKLWVTTLKTIVMSHCSIFQT